MSKGRDRESMTRMTMHGAKVALRSFSSAFLWQASLKLAVPGRRHQIDSPLAHERPPSSLLPELTILLTSSTEPMQCSIKNMKRAHKYFLSGLTIFLIVALAGIWRTGKVSRQLDVLSGKLRIQHTCFGEFPIYTSKPKENALSSAARMDGGNVDWLTIDSDRYYIYNSCGRRDYRTLFSVFYAINLQVVDPYVRQEFARSVLRELKETRSITFTTRHLLKLLEELRSRKIEEAPEAFLIAIWESTTGSSLLPVHPSETKRTEQGVSPNGP